MKVKRKSGRRAPESAVNRLVAAVLGALAESIAARHACLDLAPASDAVVCRCGHTRYDHCGCGCVCMKCRDCTSFDVPVRPSPQGGWVDVVTQWPAGVARTLRVSESKIAPLPIVQGRVRRPV